MGCGCKNKQQSSPETQQTIQETKQQIVVQKNNTLKDTIKKTVEKYYNTGRNGTNGWVKE